MSYKLIALDSFEKELKRLKKKYPSLTVDLRDLFSKLVLDPTMGSALGKDCFKIRMSITSKGKGKSGGARVFTCVKVVNTTIYLLTIIDKSEAENISNKELIKLLSNLR
jgi:mRNA-degrading endonuclease RelE of RelBE toxin-antitoxin system